MNWFPSDTGSGASEEMGYLDGSTVTGLWHYAQFFATSDNSYATAFGPSTPGVLNLVSGQTNGVIATLNGTRDEVNRGSDGSLTMFNDADPLGDICSSSMRAHGSMSSQNIGNLFSAAGISWDRSWAASTSPWSIQTEPLDAAAVRSMRLTALRPTTCEGSRIWITRPGESRDMASG